MSARRGSYTAGLMVALGLLLSLPWQATARAQACDQRSKAAAQALIKKGTRSLRRHKARQAVDAFKQAYEHCRARVILFDLALAYRVLGDRIAAATHLRRYLAGAGPDGRKSLPPPLQQLLLEVGVLQVVAQPATASVWVDGRRVGAGRVEVVVLPGPRAVEIRLGDRVLLHKKVEIAGGQTVLWTPQVAAPPRGRALAPPITPRPVAPPPPDSRRGRRLHWAYFLTTAIVAVASGAALTYCGIRTLQLRSDYVANPTRAVERDFDRTKLASNVLVAVTAASGATAAILALFTRWRRGPGHRETPRVSVAPAILWGGAGLDVRGRF